MEGCRKVYVEDAKANDEELPVGFGFGHGDAKKRLRNRPLDETTVRALKEKAARETAVELLSGWVRRAFAKADERLYPLQVEDNLQQVSSIPGWMDKKGTANGYVMLTSMMDASLKPTILTLDSGGLTYRQLHEQLRTALNLERRVSLRVIRYRPWHRWITRSCPVPEMEALPCNDIRCRRVLGTTLLYWTYVHLRVSDEEA